MAQGIKTGGRQKGTKNKATAAKAEAIAASGLTPLDWMLSVLRDPKVDDDRRDKAARDAAPYVHSRLQSTTIKGEGEDGAIKTVTEIRYTIVDPRPPNTEDVSSTAGPGTV